MLVAMGEEVGIFCLSAILSLFCPKKRASKSPSLKWAGIRLGLGTEEHRWGLGEQQRTGHSIELRVGRLD